jgi:hypothetical protein
MFVLTSIAISHDDSALVTSSKELGGKFIYNFELTTIYFLGSSNPINPPHFQLFRKQKYFLK